MYVCFIDLLGFASAVMSMPETDEHRFYEAVKLRSASDMMPLEIAHSDISTARLYRDYVIFQRVVSEQIKIMEQNLAMEYRTKDSVLRTILFSDSIFIACNKLHNLVEAAAGIYRSLLDIGPVPCRGGIAKGSFTSFDWSIRASEGGRFHANAPFLGKGVVAAYFAESKGVKGLRLLLHSSMIDDINQQAPHFLLELPEKEKNDFACGELNLVEGGNYKSMKRDILMLKKAAPEKLHPRYEATLTALQRMNKQYRANKAKKARARKKHMKVQKGSQDN